MMSRTRTFHENPSGTSEVVKRPSAMADAFRTAMVRSGLIGSDVAIMLPTIREAAWAVKRKG
jgi:ribosomal protein S3